MDDMACGGANTAKVSRLKYKLINRFKDGHFNMTKWKSNVPELRDQVISTARVSGQTVPQPQPSSTNIDNTKEKVLGVTLNQETDHMGVSFEKVSTWTMNPHSEEFLGPWRRSTIPLEVQVHHYLGEVHLP